MNYLSLITNTIHLKNIGYVLKKHMVNLHLRRLNNMRLDFEGIKKQLKYNDETKKYVYTYPTNVFQKHLTKYLTDHIAAWDSKYAFNGEDQVIDFYNEIIEIGTLDNDTSG